MVPHDDPLHREMSHINPASFADSKTGETILITISC